MADSVQLCTFQVPNDRPGWFLKHLEAPMFGLKALNLNALMGDWRRMPLRQMDSGVLSEPCNH